MGLLMSSKEPDRLQAVGQVERGELAQGVAAALLGIGELQLRRSLRRYEAEGDAGLVHRRRGGKSNRRVAPGAWAATTAPETPGLSRLSAPGERWRRPALSRRMAYPHRPAGPPALTTTTGRAVGTCGGTRSAGPAAHRSAS